VPVKLRCSMIDTKGKGCERKIEYRVIREDGTEQELCRVCAFKLRDQIQHYPNYFDSVRFVALNPASQLTKY
jgi:isopentenyldiphosphate isomerase